MYAILIDFNNENNYSNAIKDFMLENSFSFEQGGLFFSSEKTNAVHCVLTIQKLSKKYPWFATCIKDVRMLRIEENINLMRVIE